MNIRLIISSILLATCSFMGMHICAQQLDRIKFGDFNQWVTRNLKESAVIGGKERTVYEIGPTATIEGNKAYHNGISPWGTSNVYAKVSGITKCSNAVYPAVRGAGNKCAKLCTQMEHVKVLGIIDMNVMVTGSIFLGEMIEPISSTKNPYSKMNMGVPYTHRPKSLVIDYKLDMPENNIRTKATGFSPTKTLPGRDEAAVFVFLQRRWEDAKGNIHAKRVGTGGKTFRHGTNWVNGYKIPIVYGNCSANPAYKWLGLRTKNNAYYARNSKGKMVPVIEEGWDEANATPTHVILMMSSGNGEPYVGTEGLTFYVDNVAFEL